MTAAARTMTAEELWKLPDNGGRNELLDGELLPMSPINMRHMQIASRIYFLLQTYLNDHPLGIAGQELGCLVARNPDVLLAPDVLFITAKRLPAGPLPEKYFSGSPDLAIEVLSPNDSWQEVETKAHRYLDSGTAAVWIVNPKTETVTIYLPGPTLLHLKKEDTINGGPALPGFVSPVSALFA